MIHGGIVVVHDSCCIGWILVVGCLLVVVAFLKHHRLARLDSDDTCCRQLTGVLVELKCQRLAALGSDDACCCQLTDQMVNKFLPST